MPHDEVDGLGEVFARHLRTARPVLDGKGVVAHPAQCDGERKSLVDRPDIRPTAARTDDGERPSRFSPEEEQSRVVLARIRPLLRFGVDVVEQSVAVVYIVDHPVDGLHSSFARYVVVIRQHVRHVPKRQIVVIPPFGRQDELPEAGESLVVHHILYRVRRGQMSVSIHIPILSVRKKERQRIVEVLRHRPVLMPCTILFVKSEVGEREHIRKPRHRLDLHQSLAIGRIVRSARRPNIESIACIRRSANDIRQIECRFVGPVHAGESS